MAKKKVTKKVAKKNVVKKTSSNKPAPKRVERTEPPKMNKSTKKTGCCSSWTIITLRLLLGLLFLFAGVMKLLVLLGGKHPLLDMGIPIFLTWVVMVVEILGGAFLLINILKVESTVLLGIIFIVALILLVANPATWKNWVDAILKVIFPHLIGIAALLAVLFEKKTC